MIKRLKHFPFEALIWIGALVFLAFTSPESSHFTLCPLAAAGFEFCPGCGLGRAVSLLLHGYPVESWNAHPLGIFAVIVLLIRVFKLTTSYLHTYGKSY
jgi:hypothetical protein